MAVERGYFLQFIISAKLFELWDLKNIRRMLMVEVRKLEFLITLN